MGKYLYKRAMVIDDSKLDRFISEAIIKKNQFAEEVLDFSYATSALAHLQNMAATPEALPQVIFLDINMPVMDGFGFLDNYEQLPEEVKRRCNIIMISSSNSQDDFARIKTYPSVRKFFSKPLSDIILDDIRMNVPVAVPS
jgi:CheY-like chemotaxis protein